ncbi:hypothetical protein RhiirA4_472085 [Rhizophagus irregularis]|uniref:Uncharacterized protein n=1 Tax=Rhizophagus irregularis TaxID=588596 RepID=A0A2I1H4D3_9GLOM|nr:hypothetical protein RhiirA4_472085 [Rhizophagus irregularis]
MRGTIIEQKCNVKFIKFIPYDLVACLYIALVCIGNTIKATFDKDALAEIHASSNNIDKLQSLIAKCYKNIHSVQYKKFDIHNYVCCIASLNKHVSKLENEIWERHANNTNIAEAAHTQANRKGKHRHLDERIFMIAETHDRYGIPYIRRDKSRKQKEISKESKKKVPIQDISNQEKPEKRGVK